MIEIDISKTIYQLVKEYPVMKEIMIELGFTDIVKPGLLQSVGRIMTIDKGCSMKGISIEVVEEVLACNGFKLKYTS